MRCRHLVVLCVVALAVVAAAGTALGQSATIDWQKPFDSQAPQNNPTINTGESVTWNVTEGGHNVDVMGPENFKSTSGEDSSGTQFTHTFTKPGKYTYLCDYHSSMHGTITVVAPPAPQPQPQPQPEPQPQPAPGAAPQPVSGDAAAVDTAAPQLRRVSLHASTLRVRLSERSKLTVRVRRVGARRVAKHVLRGHAGVNTIRLARWTRHGRYHVSVVATDAAGNVSRPLRLALRL